MKKTTSPCLNPFIDEPTSRMSRHSTYGTKAAAEMRAKCNNMTQKERDRNVKYAMKLINGGWRGYLAKLKAGNLFAVLHEVAFLENQGYEIDADPYDNTTRITVFGAKEIADSDGPQYCASCKTQAEFLRWLVKTAKEVRGL